MLMINIKSCIPRRLRASHKRALVRVAALGVALALLLMTAAGCAQNASVGPSPTATAPEAIVEEDTLPQNGGQLLLPMPFNPPSFDPLLTNTKEMQAILSLVYEPLLRYDASNRLSLSLAESWEPADEAGLSWRIRLRSDVMWHNSADSLTSEDVLYTIELLKSDAYKSSPYASAMSSIASYKAEDSRTILITGAEPGNAVLHALTFPVVSHSRFTSGKMVGTGPYKVKYAEKATGMELEANDRWWRQPPYIGSILAYAVADNETALAMLSIHKLNFVTTEVLTAGKYREEGVTKVFEIMTQQSEVLLINHNKPKFQDVRVRQAIANALDRREIISKAYLNHAFSCDVPVPPDSWLYDPSSKVFDFNVEKAKGLLEQAGYKDRDGDGIADDENGNPFSVILLVNDTPDNQVRKDVAQLIKAQLLKIGIDAQITQLLWSRDKNEYSKALDAGAFDLALAGFSLDRNFNLDVLLKAGGARNYGGYKDEQMEELLGNVKKAVLDKDIKAAAAAVQKRFVEQLPFIHLYFRTNSIVYSDNLKGISDLRGIDVLRTVEKWNFDTAGRTFYSGNIVSALTAQTPPPEVTPTPEATPKSGATPTPKATPTSKVTPTPKVTPPPKATPTPEVTLPLESNTPA